MEYKNKTFYSDEMCVMNANNKEFLDEQLQCIEGLLLKDNFWLVFNGTSVGSLLYLLNYSTVLTNEQKESINKLLSKIPEKYLMKIQHKAYDETSD